MVFRRIGDDRLASLALTIDGGILLAGYSSSAPSGNKEAPSWGDLDIWLVCLDAKFQKRWDISFGGTLSDYVSKIRPLADGGLLVCGYSTSPISGNKESPRYGFVDFWLLRLERDGSKRWERSFGGDGLDVAADVLETEDGGFVVGGYSTSSTNAIKQSPNFGSADFWLLKVDANGNRLWDRTYGGQGDDEMTAICATLEGGFILGGQSDSIVSGNKAVGNEGLQDFWVVRVDAEGHKLSEWGRGGTGIDSLSCLLSTPDGGFVAGGSSRSGTDGTKSSSSWGAADYWVVCVNSDGQTVWDVTFGGTNNDLLYSVVRESNGTLLLGGSSASPESPSKASTNFGLSDYWLVCIDAHGKRLWDISIGGDNTDDLRAMIPTPTGGLVLGGTSLSATNGVHTSLSFGSRDLWIVDLGPVDFIAQAPTLTIERGEPHQQSGMPIYLTGCPNFFYVLEGTLDFVGWSPLATNLFVCNPLKFMDSGQATNSFRFYRAKRLP